MSASRHRVPTAWNCSSVVACSRRCLISVTVRSTLAQPVGSSNIPGVGEPSCCNCSSNGSYNSDMNCLLDAYVGRSPLLNLLNQPHKSKNVFGSLRPLLWSILVL